MVWLKRRVGLFYYVEDVYQTPRLLSQIKCAETIHDPKYIRFPYFLCSCETIQDAVISRGMKVVYYSTSMLRFEGNDSVRFSESQSVKPRVFDLNEYHPLSPCRSSCSATIRQLSSPANIILLSFSMAVLHCAENI